MMAYKNVIADDDMLIEKRTGEVSDSQVGYTRKL